MPTSRNRCTRNYCGRWHLTKASLAFTWLVRGLERLTKKPAPQPYGAHITNWYCKVLAGSGAAAAGTKSMATQFDIRTIAIRLRAFIE